MNEEKAMKIIMDYCMNVEYYFAENDCYPKDYDEDFHEALKIALDVLREKCGK